MKSKTQDKANQVNVGEVIRHGKAIIVPEAMQLSQAVEILTTKMEYEEEFITITEVVDCYPWDGAIALERVLNNIVGIATTKSFRGGFMGMKKFKPREISIETDYDSTTNATWGRFPLPVPSDPSSDDENYLECDTEQRNGRIVFAIAANVQRKYVALIKEIADGVRAEIKTNSIYRGKSFRVSFFESSNSRTRRTMAEVKFFNPHKIDLFTMVYSRELEQSIETNILTPIKKSEAVRAAGIPLKRGVLLAGPYGTGKTLLAARVAKEAIDNNWTFIQIERADELAQALQFAAQYSPAVVFCEDIDRSTRGDRTAEMDEILNTLDGVHTKGAEIVTVLTTNHIEQINKAMLRPGRLDVILNILPPDAEAVERLIRRYGRGLIPETADISSVAARLAGQIPATIREVVERAKLSAIAHRGGADTLLTVDLTDAAYTMEQQQAIFAEPAKVDVNPALGFASMVADQVINQLELDQELTNKASRITINNN